MAFEVSHAQLPDALPHVDYTINATMRAWPRANFLSLFGIRLRHLTILREAKLSGYLGPLLIVVDVNTHQVIILPNHARPPLIAAKHILNV